MKRGVAVGLAWDLSWTMLFSLLLPLLAGIWLDKKLNTAPLFTLIGAALGILAARVGVARIALRMFSQVASEAPEQQAGENGKEEPD